MLKRSNFKLIELGAVDLCLVNTQMLLKLRFSDKILAIFPFKPFRLSLASTLLGIIFLVKIL